MKAGITVLISQLSSGTLVVVEVCTSATEYLGITLVLLNIIRLTGFYVFRDNMCCSIDWTKQKAFVLSLKLKEVSEEASSNL